MMSNGDVRQPGDELNGSADGVSPQPPLRLRLTRPHPLIQRTRHKSELARDPNAYRQEPDGADIDVSRSQFRLALAVMDRFFKALEGRDVQVKRFRDYNRTGVFATDGRDTTPVSLSEKYKRVQHVPTERELKAKERNPYTSIPKWDDLATGTLILTPGGIVDLASEEAFLQFIEKAVEEVIERLARERESREAREAQQRREWEERRRTEEEKSRAEAFQKAAAAFHQYRIMMEYIEEVRRFGRVPDDQRREGQSLDEWLGWAEWRARQIHPLGY